MGTFIFVFGLLIFGGCIQDNSCQGSVALFGMALIIIGYIMMKKKKKSSSTNHYSSYSSHTSHNVSNTCPKGGTHDWHRVPHDGGTKLECRKCYMRDHDSWQPS